MAATQEVLYREHDLELSWSETSLPERERTKHVHRLHPYLGKFIPQLVETLLDRHVPAGGRVLDPFAGSGTTLVQALESGLRRDRGGHRRVQRPARPREDATVQRRCPATRSPLGARRGRGVRATRPVPAGGDCLRAQRGSHRMRQRSCSISAPSSTRSARPTCSASCSRGRRDRRDARPISTSSSRASPSSSRTGASSTGASAVRSMPRGDSSFATRSTRSIASRRSRPHGPTGASHGRSTATPGRSISKGPYDGVITSPPYPGLIDYHEQHRYAYELLGLDERRDLELGRPARGTGRAAIEEYVDGIASGARERPIVARARRADVHRRQRPPQPLSRDPAACRAPARRPPRAPCQPSDGAACGRVLRVDPRRRRPLSARRPSAVSAQGSAPPRHRIRRSVGGVVARAITSAVVGLEPRRVDVEAHLVSADLPAFSIVGLADRACQEAKHRVHSGIVNSMLPWPARNRITVNLAPAALRKEGSGFDLPIALAVLASSHQLPPGRLLEHACVGELSLDGRVRPVAGTIAVAEGARRAGLRLLVCAAESAPEAALAGIDVIPVHHLARGGRLPARRGGDRVRRPAGERRAGRAVRPRSRRGARARSEAGGPSSSPPQGSTTSSSLGRRARARRCSAAACRHPAATHPGRGTRGDQDPLGGGDAAGRPADHA